MCCRPSPLARNEAPVDLSRAEWSLVESGGVERSQLGLGEDTYHTIQGSSTFTDLLFSTSMSEHQ